MKRLRPFGSWPSPLDSAALVRGARAVSSPRLAHDSLYWLERRPEEAGRQVVMRARLAVDREAPRVEAIEEVSPADANVRTRVHEYGGGEYTVWRDCVFFVDDAAGCIRGGRVGGELRRLSEAGSRFADLVVSPDGRWLVAVEERAREGREPENRLIGIALSHAADGTPRARQNDPVSVVASGHDFYAAPAFAPDAARLVFLAWDHPHMPWHETVLEQVAWSAAGAASGVRRLAGGRGESLFAPGFDADGSLFVVSDRSGFWNLARVADDGLRPVHAHRGELGRPLWQLGLSTWTVIAPGRVLASVTEAGSDRLAALDLATGALEAWPSACCTVGGLTSDRGRVAWVASTPTRGHALYLASISNRGASAVGVRDAGPAVLDDAAISRAEAIELALADGRTTHAFYHPPTSPTCSAPAQTRPPLIVKSHGGPTAATSAGFDPRIQFWTSRGFAVADVNYVGSSGYGRAYRDGLERAWGVLDVADCAGVASALADAGRVDAERLAITGGSAGGFTTLCALTFHSVFRAGASHYGIGDLEALARDTHKFESHYTDWLVGRWPEERARYVERSPVHHVDRLACPVIFFQGLEDRVVPPNQAQAMVAALARRGIDHAYVPFAGEGHGFRRAENIRAALDGELAFYARVFGFEVADPLDAPEPAEAGEGPGR